MIGSNIIAVFRVGLIALLSPVVGKLLLDSMS